MAPILLDSIVLAGFSQNAAFIGPSGSGKTTLLDLIAGISLPQSGKIETDGDDVTTLSESARRDFLASA